jgi:SAM-dependent methyltransferase
VVRDWSRLPDEQQSGGGAERGLLLTGERTLPGIAVENYWFRRHEAAYLALAPYCRGGMVLEAGCGEGYGAALLAGVARRVLALDYDVATVAHAAATYPGLAVLRGNLAALPLAAGSVEVVASLQVVEHLWDQPGFVRECARVLRPGGRLLVTTPNRLTFSPGRDTPLNPFHSRELSAAELAGLLAGGGFRVGALRGLRHGPRLARLDARHGGSLVTAQLAAPPESWPARLRADVATVTAADFELAEADIDASLDLVAVAELPASAEPATPAASPGSAQRPGKPGIPA